MSFLASFITPQDRGEWRDVPRFSLGKLSSRVREAVASVGISAGCGGRWRVDLFGGVGHSCFQDVRCSGEWVYIGYGDQIAVIAAKAGSVVSHSLDGYFGHIFTASDLDAAELGGSVLVASASELLRFGSSGQLMWYRYGLGLDGVGVNRIEDDVIFGEGEWDPPGGWKPFQLNLDTGEARRN